MTQYVDYVYDTLQSEIDQQKADLRRLTALTERSEQTGGVASSTLANAPLASTGGVSGGDMLWISDGCKSAEGAGAGTGVIAYYNPVTDAWLRLSDDAAVTV